MLILAIGAGNDGFSFAPGLPSAVLNFPKRTLCNRASHFRRTIIARTCNLRVQQELWDMAGPPWGEEETPFAVGGRPVRGEAYALPFEIGFGEPNPASERLPRPVSPVILVSGDGERESRAVPARGWFFLGKDGKSAVDTRRASLVASRRQHRRLFHPIDSEARKSP